MNDLAIIENGNRQWINARDLHKGLEVGRDFSTWIKDRIGECKFEEGREYFPNRGNNEYSPDLGNIQPRKRGQPKIEYLLSMPSALILAAKENSPKQREILRLLSKTMEAWNTPEMVQQRAAQMGVMPVQAGGLTEAQATQLALLPAVLEHLENPKAKAYQELEKFVANHLEVDEKRIHTVSVWHLHRHYEKNVKHPLSKHEFMFKIALEHPEFELKCSRKEWFFTRCRTKTLLL